VDLKQRRPRRGGAASLSRVRTGSSANFRACLRCQGPNIGGVEGLVDPPPPMSVLVEASSGCRLPVLGDEMDAAPALERISYSTPMAAAGGASRSTGGRRRDDTRGRLKTVTLFSRGKSGSTLPPWLRVGPSTCGTHVSVMRLESTWNRGVETRIDVPIRLDQFLESCLSCLVSMSQSDQGVVELSGAC
jgi:hypothetical protein